MRCSFYDQNEFALDAVGIGTKPVFGLPQSALVYGFEKLGDLSRNEQTSRRAERLSEIRDGFEHPMRRLVKHEHIRQCRDGFEGGAPFARFGRQKPIEQEMRAGEPAHRERSGGGVRTRNRDDPVTRFAYRCDDPSARIREGGGPRVAHERDRTPCIELRDHLRRRALLVVLVQRDQLLRGDSVVVEELRSDPRVFGRDYIDVSENFQRAKSQVFQVTDGCGDYI